MYYEINVSLHGKHFFATHERSISTEDKLKEVLKEFIRAFPSSLGYEISATKVEQRIERVKIASLVSVIARRK